MVIQVLNSKLGITITYWRN